jgi:hypothetical protein
MSRVGLTPGNLSSGRSSPARLFPFPLQCNGNLAGDLQCDFCLNDGVHQPGA